MKLQGRYLEEFLSGRKNNLDIIRFLAASLVILSHAYPLTIGHNATEPFGLFTHSQSTFGSLAVGVFFIISGFLITQSFDRTKDLVRFSQARIFRIIPGLMAVVTISVFIVGPIFTTLNPIEYFTHPQTYDYLRTIFMYPIQYDLPGVFETNTAPISVNGSLWTLWYEFLFYGVVGLLGAAKLLNKRIVIVSVVASTILFHFGQGGYYTDLFRYFGMGMLFYLYRARIVQNGWVAFFSFLVVVMSAKLGHFNYIFPIFGSYFIFYIGYASRITLQHFGKYGDFSYGIYIYAFPIQQMVVYFFNNEITPLQNFIISYPITILFAIASWHLVEKKAMKLRNVVLVKSSMSVQ
ncbi:acyltransferase family protein [Bacillus tuaregi]|uniref:acyltransferase family protein n=1 Tax=Bacillus tuaregi TaxID=1816695 RepID=UPI0008F94CC4|nr:acyltransferase [Bacillus tuaregi]